MRYGISIKVIVFTMTTIHKQIPSRLREKLIQSLRDCRSRTFEPANSRPDLHLTKDEGTLNMPSLLTWIKHTMIKVAIGIYTHN